MVKQTLLLIEDDPDIVELLQFNLEREGYPVIVATDGEAGVRLATQQVPAAILLDLMLPGIDGLEVCRQLKSAERTAGVPVMMLTAKSEEADVVLGLELGADDYVAKPFSPREVVARVRALLRRNQAAAGAGKLRIDLDGVVLDLERYEISVEGAVVDFTRAEFRLFWTLASHPGRVYTRDQLVERITDGEALILDRNVDVHVSSIRKKLGEHGQRIATVRGVGYKCKD